ncbi:MAG: trypsin-like peptidase domain-containing protein [Acidobacteria bacterium]|nr:trypsin-like peptidase domain-containing protein [Acidobacteriota bacterium]
MTPRGVRVLVASSGALLAAALSATAVAQEEAPPARPIVQVAQTAGPAVVNVSTEEKVDNPFHRTFLQAVFGSLFDVDPSGAAATGSLGSGVLVDARGYVLTNEHVILRGTKIFVRLADRRRLPAEVVGTDPTSDLAVLKIEGGADFPSIPFGRSSDLAVGQRVIALGNTQEGPGRTIAVGVVSSLHRQVRAGGRVDGDFIQTDAAVSAGNSGGPLLTLKGELVGVSTSLHIDGPAVSLAIPADRARKVFADMLGYGEVRGAWLGLDVRTVPAMVDLDGAGLPAGAAVRRVYPGSPAERAGIVEGDVIVQMATAKIESHEDFDAAVSGLRTGDGVSLAFYRGSENRAASLTVGEFPPGLAEAYLSDQVGVDLADISPAMRAQYPQLPPEGVIVTRVRVRSHAHATGLEEGDVLRQIDGTTLHEMTTLRAAVPRMVGRGSLLLKVARGRNSYYVTLDME